MMNMVEEAIIYATILHQGKIRKMNNIPYILHPLEVSQILSTMTDDPEIIAAGVLHDIVEDTDGTLIQIEKRFGKRVAELVNSETEKAYRGEDRAESWRRRKEESLLVLKNSTDVAVKMLWLADKLANIRSLSGNYSELGDEVWKAFHQNDPEMHRWYYRSVAEYVEYDLNRTGAYKEFIKHINFIWPGTFASEKTRFRRYKEVSVDGCPLIGTGAKGNVYRLDDELIIKVYHDGITYQEVEKEIAISKKAFVMGLPTAISFGIAAVGKGYGAMFELIDSVSVSECIARSSRDVSYYAKMMASLAHQIHETEAFDDSFPDSTEKLRERVERGLGREDKELAASVISMIDALPKTRRLIHGDFHTGNVLLQNNEPILIDLDELSFGHPIFDLGGMFMSYVALGEEDPEEAERYKGFSYETSLKFFSEFMKYYLDTDDEKIICDATDKAALLGYVRMISHIRKKDQESASDTERIAILTGRIRELLGKIDSLEMNYY